MIANHQGFPEPSPAAFGADPFAADPFAADPFAADSAGAQGARVVIVDDDPGLRELLTEFLVDHGLRAEAVESGAALRARLGRHPCDLIVLDMMMPGEDGLSVLRTLTQSDDAPAVIMFSALAGEVDRVVALELGADDYVTKPSSPREILARIRSVLRRRGAGAPVSANTSVATGEAPRPARVETYAFAGWTLNCRMRTLHAPDGAPVRLTDGEFQLLNAFVTQPQKVHSRDDMIAQSGRTEAMAGGRTIDVNISRLRRKLQEFDPAEIIRTVRGNGYIFMPEVIAA
ncbi:response regulator [Sphingomonas sp. 4RDLI-65]|uniref:response regulator n=1 Tax=Sphingomonas sp. 4RDLI-65 TaxID=3111641 RepID=UPI003C1AEF0F